LVQEALLLAWRHFSEFRGTTGPELVRWLQTILRHVAVSQARHEARAGHPIRAHATADEGMAGTPGPEPPDPTLVPPDEAVADQERDAAVRNALAALPEDYRTAVRLRYFEHLPFDEVGRRLGRSGEAARKMVMRAAQELGARLGPLDGPLHHPPVARVSLAEPR
jgi:RNA polymerase sigma-70 factor (ECF subfamily)